MFNHIPNFQKKASISSLDSKNTFLNNNNLQKDYYDYLCKIILVGPSGSGKTSILHRFVKGDFPTLRSQTIGVEFSSKILYPFAAALAGVNSHNSGSGSGIGIGAVESVSGSPLSQQQQLQQQQPWGISPPPPAMIPTIDGTGCKLKLQMWDTAGQERFRSLTRSYYRCTAGVIMVFDLSDRQSLIDLKEFVVDVINLTEPTTSVLIVGNKLDIVDPSIVENTTSSSSQGQSQSQETDPQNWVTNQEIEDFLSFVDSKINPSSTATVVTSTTTENPTIPTTQTQIKFMKVSAFANHRITECFQQLGSSILTKIELGDLNPEDGNSGVQFGNNVFDLDASSTICSGTSSLFRADSYANTSRYGAVVGGGGGRLARKNNIRLSSAYPFGVDGSRGGNRGWRCC
ncbi:unnamed protein product [Ambrosiozyma monospora]|uniref:Unnamed protein product n=1 Tax=Ambrosiozyma monospora TaxID=43982 RepID=A0ACB5T2Z6_AMBMO|nr:unnamed protein product [Ambrosiozyma monospora]